MANTPSSPLVAASSITGFFEEVVEDAVRARRVDATDGSKSYLVSLLADFAKPSAGSGGTFERPVTFLLDEALHTPVPAERFEKLRVLGDGVLYGCGFFGEHFEARGVEQRYLIGIGATAYGNAASMLRGAGEEESGTRLDIFGELAGKFGTFVGVLAEIADRSLSLGTGSPSSLLKLYERWLKTGSDRLAEALTHQGVLPTRGPRGVVQ